MLRKLKLWVPLDAADEAALLGLPHSIATVPKGRTIIAEGDIVAHCWLVLTGFCVRYKTVGDGGRQIVSIHMKGDLVDLQNAIVGDADHSVQTLTACKMAKIPIEASEITNLPNNTIAVEGEIAQRLLKLIDALEDNDDIQTVSHNAEIPESVIV